MRNTSIESNFSPTLPAISGQRILQTYLQNWCILLECNFKCCFYIILLGEPALADMGVKDKGTAILGGPLSIGLIDVA